MTKFNYINRIPTGRTTLEFDSPNTSPHYPRVNVFRCETLLAPRKRIAMFWAPLSPGPGCFWDLQPQVTFLEPISAVEMDVIWKAVQHLGWVTYGNVQQSSQS